MEKLRLDKYCCRELGSRAKAQDKIKNGDVCVNGKIIKKSSFLVSSQDSVVIDTSKREYVSRGAYKLLTAMDHWHIDIEDQTVLDIGASTGGFTDVCLQYHAKRIYALDVGHFQLAPALAQNPLVIKMEGKNAREIQKSWFSQPIDFICMDVSFISCKTILETVFEELPVSHLVLLIKPQFECGPRALNAKGVLTSTKQAHQIVDAIVQYVKTTYTFVDVIPSAIRGRNGNQEYVLYAKERRVL